MSAEGEIVEGSLVRLKSGGPVMTVTRVDTWLDVAWFAGLEMAKDSLPASAVELLAKSESVDYKTAFFHAWRSRGWTESDIELKWAEHERAMEQKKAVAHQ